MIFLKYKKTFTTFFSKTLSYWMDQLLSGTYLTNLYLDKKHKLFSELAEKHVNLHLYSSRFKQRSCVRSQLSSPTWLLIINLNLWGSCSIMIGISKDPYLSLTTSRLRQLQTWYSISWYNLHSRCKSMSP